MSSSFDIQRVQDRLLKMAVEIKNVLEKHDIPYQIAFGTLLGAVRHKGFIPWDDDFDFFLFDETYDEAIELLREELPRNMFVEDGLSEPRYFHGWAHVKDLNSEAYCDYYYQDNLYSHHGLSVDLYRIKRIQEKDFAQFRLNEALAYINRRKDRNAISEEEYQARKKSYESRIESGESNGSDKYILAYPFDIGRQFIEDVFPLKRYQFDGVEFWGPNNARHILEMRYGDWESLPPESERKSHYSRVAFI